MLRVLLVRHASCNGTGACLHGRAPGVLLNPDGEAQASVLAAELRAEPLAAVVTSPLERAVATATAIAAPHELQPRTDDAFTEIDFGDWTGRTTDSFDRDPVWRDFNTHRSTTRIPGGDWMPDVQTRALAGLLRLQQQHDGTSIVVVSHSDVIRAALAGLLGMPLDLMLRLEVEPASISTLELHGTWPRVLSVNARPVQ